MNDKQKKWTRHKCDLLVLRAGDFRLSENDWEELHYMANCYVRQAKGNPEVKTAIINTISYIESMYKLERNND